MNLDQLRSSVERRLALVARRGTVTGEDVEAVLLDAGEYAAAQVELHARPGPWPPRRPERRGGSRAAREAS